MKNIKKNTKKNKNKIKNKKKTTSKKKFRGGAYENSTGNVNDESFYDKWPNNPDANVSCPFLPTKDEMNHCDKKKDQDEKNTCFNELKEKYKENPEKCNKNTCCNYKKCDPYTCDPYRVTIHKPIEAAKTVPKWFVKLFHKIQKAKARAQAMAIKVGLKAAEESIKEEKESIKELVSAVIIIACVISAVIIGK
jgi:hypothetical protein